jgi:hypothetical protein
MSDTRSAIIVSVAIEEMIEVDSEGGNLRESLIEFLRQAKLQDLDFSGSDLDLPTNCEDKLIELGLARRAPPSPGHLELLYFDYQPAPPAKCSVSEGEPTTVSIFDPNGERLAVLNVTPGAHTDFVLPHWPTPDD